MQYFTASDGATIAYREEGNGRPLVLLHGLMAHGGFFEPQRSLADQFRLIAVDLRGHGQSRADAADLTTEKLAQDVAELAEALGLRDAIGVGWSLGASVLWHVLTGPASSCFAGAVVVDMTPRVRNEGDWDLGLSTEMCEARGAAIRDDFATFAANAGQAIYAQPIDASRQAMADWSAREFGSNDAAAIGAIWASLVKQDFRAMLAGIDQPTLVIHGAQSQLYGSDTADHLVAALPNARAIEFQHSGHAPHLEQAELFNRAIREFAASLPRVRQTTAIA